MMEIMEVYKSSCKKGELGQLGEFYYENRNPRLLLDLLCSSSGTALPLRSLALLEPTFNQSLLPSLQPSGVKGLVQARVLQPSLLAHLLKSSSTSIAFLAQVNQDRWNEKSYNLQLSNQTGDTCRALSWVSPQLLEASFSSSSPLTESIVLTTLVNGKVVASSKVVLSPTSEQNERSVKKMEQQHSLVVVSEESGESEMR